MKKIIAILLIVGALMFVGIRYLNPNNPQVSQAETPSATESSEESPKLSITEPTRIEIPSINVDADIEYVGLDVKKNMDVPKAAENVGWYNLGPKPGEQGSAVVAGHLDDPDGNPAVFWNLTKLKPNDEIKVTDKSGSTKSFRVTQIESYEVDKFPLQEVFADASGKKLNLITCEGTFDKVAKNYSRRTVVYSELIE